jgi:hypothetical protein
MHCLIGVATGIWMLTPGASFVFEGLDSDERWMWPWLPLLAILFFGAIAWLTACWALNRRPQIVLTPSGFSWRKWSQVEIPWSEIVEIKPYGFARYITITLRDPARYRADNASARFHWINGIRGAGDLTIPVRRLNRSAKDIVAAMERFPDAAARPNPPE